MYYNFFIYSSVDGHYRLLSYGSPPGSSISGIPQARILEWVAIYFSNACMRPHGGQSTRLLHPWDSPGKNTGVGCCFLLQAIVNSAAVNNGIHVSFSIFVSSGYMPRTGIVESHSGFSPSFLRNLHTVFPSGCINLHFHQQCNSVPFSPHPFQHLLFVDFL